MKLGSEVKRGRSSDRGVGARRSAAPAGVPGAQQLDPTVPRPAGGFAEVGPPGWCPRKALTFHPQDLCDQKPCVLSFGNNTVIGADLTSPYLPPGYTPRLSRDTALMTLLPEWFGPFRSDGVKIKFAWPLGRREWGARPGLFFDSGDGLGRSAIRMAAQTVHAFAADATIDGDLTLECFSKGARSLENLVERTSLVLAVEASGCSEASQQMSVSPEGRLSVSKGRGGTINAEYSWKGFVRLCDQWLLDCAVADFYFWWAWRLLGWALERDRSDLTLGLAGLCARAGLAQIVELGGELIHEYGHAKALAHCVDPLRYRNGCCQFVADQLFKSVMQARCGLPEALLTNRTAAGDIRLDRRFEADLLGPWETRPFSSCGLSGAKNEATKAGLSVPADPNARVTAAHTSLVKPHAVAISWDVPSICTSRKRSDSGSVGAAFT